jgi:hypothetical protein
MTGLGIRGSVHPIEVKDCSLWPTPMTSQRMPARKRCQTRTYLQRDAESSIRQKPSGMRLLLPAVGDGLGSCVAETDTSTIGNPGQRS